MQRHFLFIRVRVCVCTQSNSHLLHDFHSKFCRCIDKTLCILNEIVRAIRNKTKKKKKTTTATRRNSGNKSLLWNITEEDKAPFYRNHPLQTYTELSADFILFGLQLFWHKYSTEEIFFLLDKTMRSIEKVVAEIEWSCTPLDQLKKQF